MVKEPNRDGRAVASLQFSSGTLGREVLAFTEVSQLCLDIIFFMLNKLLVEQRRYYSVFTSLTQHHLRSRRHSNGSKDPLLKSKSYAHKPLGPSALFFDPDGEIMYVGRQGKLFEWKLREREGPEWWLGEGYDA
jgi:hypothetical protein